MGSVGLIISIHGTAASAFRGAASASCASSRGHSSANVASASFRRPASSKYLGDSGSSPSPIATALTIGRIRPRRNINCQSARPCHVTPKSSFPHKDPTKIPRLMKTSSMLPITPREAFGEVSARYTEMVTIPPPAAAPIMPRARIRITRLLDNPAIKQATARQTLVARIVRTRPIVSAICPKNPDPRMVPTANEVTTKDTSVADRCRSFWRLTTAAPSTPISYPSATAVTLVMARIQMTVHHARLASAS
mmetsp:Transcript_83144/g.222184  ORF Transcript_83144/g.222184 Transcript_83144/m.222184 type:complete len:250 (-) Transcript_83144:128-877(-)